MYCLLKPLLSWGGAWQRQEALRGRVVLRERVEELLAGFGGLEKKRGRRLFMRISATRLSLASTYLVEVIRGSKLETGKQLLEPRHHVLDALLELD